MDTTLSIVFLLFGLVIGLANLLIFYYSKERVYKALTVINLALSAFALPLDLHQMSLPKDQAQAEFPLVALLTIVGCTSTIFIVWKKVLSPLLQT